MVRVSVQVRKDGGHSEVELLEVRAESIEGALAMVRERNPGAECGIEFPIDPERFFVDEVSRKDVAA